MQMKIAVVGGGASGMMAAITAARDGKSVTLFEKNKMLGRKLLITGKGRCNLTNDCDIGEFMKNVPTNPRFLYGALNRFSTEDTKSFFEELGVPLKTERGKRVFPQSDKASDIVRALADRMRDCGVKIVTDKITDVDIVDGEVRGHAVPRNAYGIDYLELRIGGRKAYGEEITIDYYNRELRRRHIFTTFTFDGETHGTLSDPVIFRVNEPADIKAYAIDHGVMRVEG